MLIAPPPKLVGEKRLTFRHLDWHAFKQIQSLLSERTRARFTYDNRVLEITMSLEGHGRSARLIELFIRILDEVAAEIDFRQWVRQQVAQA